MSRVCTSNNIYILKLLIPAILILPIDIPSFYQRASLSFLSFLRLADPLFLLPCLGLLSYVVLSFTVSYILPMSCALFGSFLVLFTQFIKSTFVVTLAQWGACPEPTSAGLELGGGWGV
jgi:hypothetical protein